MIFPHGDMKNTVRLLIFSHKIYGDWKGKECDNDTGQNMSDSKQGTMQINFTFVAIHSCKNYLFQKKNIYLNNKVAQKANKNNG